MLARLPLPQMRIVFRSAFYALVGCAVFAVEFLTGLKFLWWIGLMFVYMGLQRLVVNMFDQTADMVYNWHLSRSPKFMAWLRTTTDLCAQHKVAIPADAFHIFSKGVGPDEACRMAIKRSRIPAVAT